MACRGYVLRVSASCTLRNLYISGDGVDCRKKWRFRHWGLVEMHGGDNLGAPLSVAMEKVGIGGGAHGNGVRVLGAVDVRMHGCSVSNCQWNGMIVAVRGNPLSTNS
jgi:hypothetical protein